ncbi:MAG: di-trans,poly-cis-decaprenylcistransferase [Dehalococcoidia bacterium]|nr:di-trans,poly-cis-decaprenylcistransferase [Dehalococcoidia bacterium]
MSVNQGAGAKRQAEEAEERAAAAIADSALPRHVAIIMDGNGRWAKERGLPRLAGHREGTKNLRRVVRAFAERKIPWVTLYAFSTENWSRPPEEVRGLWQLLGQVIRTETEDLHKQGVRLVHIGRSDRLAPRLRQEINRAVALTRENRRLTLCVALDYGGRAEIVEAVRRIVASGTAAEQVDEAMLSQAMFTAGMPDPDLVVRTAGEMRLSNFLLWQAAYAEYYATPVCWPDFNEPEIDRALAAYAQRRRRFGGVDGAKGGGASRG